MPVVREYETMGAERGEGASLPIYTLTPDRIICRRRKSRGESAKPRGARGPGSFMPCSAYGRLSTRAAPWRSRWRLRTRRELCRATDQADDTPPLRRHDEPLRRPRERHLHKEALRVALHPGRGGGRG